MDRYEEVSLDKIDWPDPVRPEINKKDIEDMAKSVMAVGQIHPIVVEQGSESGRYNGVVGRLRYVGHQRAQKSTIFARIHSFIDNSDRKAWQLIENVVRRALNPIYMGEALEKLYNYYKETVEREEPIVEAIQVQVQDVSGEKAPSKKTIWKYMQFAKDFPESVKSMLKSLPRETFGKRHAEQLLRLKDNPDGMLEMAEYIVNKEPTSNQLKAHINDYLKVQTQAVDSVKQAVEDREISLRHAAVISEADEDVQVPVLDMAKKGLKPGDVKKVVDFMKEHEDRIPEILEKGAKEPEFAVGIADGFKVMETKEDVKAFFRKKNWREKVEDFEIPCTCPQCQTAFKQKITIDWMKGELTYD